MTDKLPPLHVIVRFGSDIPDTAQGEVMLAMEKDLRKLGIKAEVFKETMGDDSKLRVLMTPDERAKL